MKTIVIYNSRTGFTERYGKWIAQELGCKAVSYKEITPEQWKENEMIIYGGGIMAGKISGWDKVKIRPEMKNKRIIVYAVGAAPMNAQEVLEKIKNDNLTEEEQKEISFFYFEGGINYEKMGFLPKLILKTMYKSMKNKKEKTEEETEMVRLFEKSSDSSSKEYISPLLECVKRIRAE